MHDIINKTITDVINKYVSNPWGFFETRMHHERVLHYLHHDFFIKNNAADSKYVFRWEFPTNQMYSRRKKLYADKNGVPGLIDVVIKDSNEKNPEIDYGFEYGLVECDENEDEFRIKIENDVLKLTDPVNTIKNKFLICFFRCKDFDRTNTTNTKERIDTVIARSRKFADIIFEACNNVKANSLRAIFVEVLLINREIEAQIGRFPIKDAIILTKNDTKIITNVKTKTFR